MNPDQINTEPTNTPSAEQTPQPPVEARATHGPDETDARSRLSRAGNVLVVLTTLNILGAAIGVLALLVTDTNAANSSYNPSPIALVSTVIMSVALLLIAIGLIRYKKVAYYALFVISPFFIIVGGWAFIDAMMALPNVIENLIQLFSEAPLNAVSALSAYISKVSFPVIFAWAVVTLRRSPTRRILR